jgi:ribosomal protein S4E
MATSKDDLKIKDGDSCKVVKGTHAGKSGIARDIHTSKTGSVTITVVQTNGERFKTLANNVEVTKRG